MNIHDRFWKTRNKLLEFESEHGIVAKIRRKLLKRRFDHLEEILGCSLPTGASFGTKPYFPHGLFGIFVSRRSKVGSNCVIFHHVTIGVSTIPDSRGMGAPIIGDRVYIGTGAKIIGGITVGNDVRIGANATVTMDVPDNATVIGVNSVREGKPGRDNRYYSRGPGGWLANDGVNSFPVPAERSGELDRRIGSN